MKPGPTTDVASEETNRQPLRHRRYWRHRLHRQWGSGHSDRASGPLTQPVVEQPTPRHQVELPQAEPLRVHNTALAIASSPMKTRTEGTAAATLRLGRCLHIPHSGVLTSFYSKVWATASARLVGINSAVFGTEFPVRDNGAVATSEIISSMSLIM